MLWEIFFIWKVKIDNKTEAWGNRDKSKEKHLKTNISILRETKNDVILQHDKVELEIKKLSNWNGKQAPRGGGWWGVTKNIK